MFFHRRSLEGDLCVKYCGSGQQALAFNSDLDQQTCVPARCRIAHVQLVSSSKARRQSDHPDIALLMANLQHVGNMQKPRGSIMSHIPTPDTTVSSGRYPKHAYQEQNGSPHFKVILLAHLEGVKNQPERRPTSTLPPDPQNSRCEREGCGPQDLLSRSFKAPPHPRRHPATSNQAAKQLATAISKLKYLTRPGVLTVASIIFSIIPMQSQYVPCYHFVASYSFLLSMAKKHAGGQEPVG